MPPQKPGKVSIDVYKQAYLAVKNGKSRRKVCKQFSHEGLKRASLQRFMKKSERYGDQSTMGYHEGVHRILTSDMDKALAEYVLELANKFYGLSTTKVRQIAYEFAIRNKITMPNSWSTSKQAGKKWAMLFMERNKFSLKTPEATSLSRTMAFNPVTTKRVFELLRSLLAEYNFFPNEIYNVNETGVRTTHKTAKIIDLKGKKQVNGITSAERGELVTIVCGANALDNVIPPMFIYPRKRLSNSFMQ